MDLPIRHRPLAELEAPAHPLHVAMEYSGVAAFFAVEGYLAWNLARHALLTPASLAVIAVLAWLAADLVSGVVHWMADSWGSADWPWIGPNFIRAFRLHHVDPKAMTRYDWARVSGNNAIVSLLVLVPCAAIALDRSPSWVHQAIAFVAMLSAWIFATNLIHKWAHEDRPPLPVRALQRCRLILGPQHHAEHHESPYVRNYCITTGWFNPLLEYFDVFPRAERLITAVTGWVPREDDLGDLAARRLANTSPAAPPLDAGDGAPAGGEPLAETALAEPAARL